MFNVGDRVRRVGLFARGNLQPGDEGVVERSTAGSVYVVGSPTRHGSAHVVRVRDDGRTFDERGREVICAADNRSYRLALIGEIEAFDLIFDPEAIRAQDIPRQPGEFRIGDRVRRRVGAGEWNGLHEGIAATVTGFNGLHGINLEGFGVGHSAHSLELIPDDAILNIPNIGEGGGIAFNQMEVVPAPEPAPLWPMVRFFRMYQKPPDQLNRPGLSNTMIDGPFIDEAHAIRAPMQGGWVHIGTARVVFDAPQNQAA